MKSELYQKPYLMTVVCNIQIMRTKINPKYYDRIEDFKNLEKMEEDELYQLQSDLIPLYNESLKSNENGKENQ